MSTAVVQALQSAPYGKNITPHASATIGFVTREVFIQKDDDLTLVCDITVVWANGVEETLTGLAPGRYAMQIQAVRVTGTTATTIVGFQ